MSALTAHGQGLGLDGRRNYQQNCLRKVLGVTDASLPLFRPPSPACPATPVLAPDETLTVAPAAPVPSSLDGLSDTTPMDGLNDASTLREILRVQLQLLAIMTASSRAPPQQPLLDVVQATPLQPTVPSTVLPDAPQGSQTPTQPSDWQEQRQPRRLHLPTFDGSGFIDRFLERYEAYARVQIAKPVQN